MFKISSSLLYIFLGGLCFFNINSVQAFGDEYELEPSYSIINSLHKETNTTLGSMIDKTPSYRNPILKNCLLSAKKPEGGVIAPFTSQEITQFFEDQGLTKHVTEPVLSTEGQLKTFNNTYGLEFSGHGPVEEKVIELIRSLIVQGNITFLDIGSGYGSFVKRVLEACEGDLDKMTIFANECLSIQCYHAAKLLERWKQVLFYPHDILSDFSCKIDQKFNISTIFNVHHFMDSFEFESSIRTAFDMTLKNGYHIAISLSPYHLGDESLLAKFHDERVRQKKEHPGFFTRRDLSLLGVVSLRESYLPSQEVYESVFQSAGFSVEEAGYFSSKEGCPREFTYIIGKRDRR